MRYLLSLVYLFTLSLSGFAQPQVFAHNDYEKPQPLTAALAQKADYIEADVFVRNGKLVLGHTPAEADTSKRTLEGTYLKPIVALFAQHKDRVSPDRRYTFSLSIDAKDKAEEVLPLLRALLEQNLTVFNRNMNPLAIRIIVSGNRPRPEQLLDYPAFIFFDGRPSELYDDETVKRVALISDNFRSYARWDGTGEIGDDDKAKLKRIIKRAHEAGCPIRFWNAPDNPVAWKQLRKLGVDVLNTDKVAECVAAVK
ncbi:phosphatidylinositol-specific phospholipase C/glycerophosphodiester phosphodiesterase family protein [Fibrella sp. HMF5335]|uniref:Phosphatidylinositol-specific phospholipase C/glycerophosphodiester phosphodiesterase family protein n=1 Tax=Fibrella rubiginis TaxID=2817060 RepID=A0A939GJ11_9BACT|nr:phosphatidylinositol-specific phospholipase C/glycerophosphodiester phosphodiesterase family protein [Fibrella rubiginis]MBO0939979.1 phosphatidylinositol-specific phospholipase C/glycerophosphodiester phosphodiesterase family protein [Fibrella rubiginis]